MSSGVALGTLVFAVVVALWYAAHGVAGRPPGHLARTGLVALELALVTLVAGHLVAAWRAGQQLTAVEGAYLGAGVLVLPLLVAVVGGEGSERSFVGAVASAAAAVLVLRIETVL